VVSFDLLTDATDRFTDALRLFAIAPSMGSAEALVMPPSLAGGFDLPADLQVRCGMTTKTVRLSMGLEDANDLTADVLQALHSIVC
jgi:cystathionine beta-lyase/cystathionine gamma-synthase